MLESEMIVANITGTNWEAALNSNGQKPIDFCTFNNLKIMNTFFKHKEIHKFIWEARGHKSVTDYFIQKQWKSDHYLLCAKVNFPPRWLNKGKKKAPVKQEELFKVRML